MEKLLEWALDPRVLVGGVWSVLLVFAGAVLVLLRGRVRTLEYRVHHASAAVSTKDDHFGHIEVKYGGAEMDRLWLTTVSVTNDTGKDYEALPVRVFTYGETMLLGERSELAGRNLKMFSPEYFAKMELADGAGPTDAQRELYHRERGYVVPVLNRGDTVKWHYLTAVKPPVQGQQPIAGPSVWCDVLKAGMRVKIRVDGALLFGAPVKPAIALGFVATCLAFALPLAFDLPAWVAATPGAIVGFMSPVIGASIYKKGRLLVTLAVQ